MTQIHWSKANRSRHYGPRGYGILSYKGDVEPTLYINGMSFDDTSRKDCQAVLFTDFANLMRNTFSQGAKYSEFANMTCNDSIADERMLDETLWQLYVDNEIEIKCPSEKAKRTRGFSAHDLILPKSQLIFSSFGDAVKPRSRASSA